MTYSPQEIETAWQLHESLERYLKLLWNRYEDQFVERIILDNDYQFYLETQDLFNDFSDDDIPW